MRSTPVATLLAGLLTLLTITGCGQRIAGTPSAVSVSGADESLVAEYFERNNAAADEGAAAQRSFLTETQHPDFSADQCSLGDLTLTMAPALSTLRPDAGWRPLNSSETPRGRVYIVAVTVTIQRGKAPVGTQIGSVHVVVLDGAAYGFAPCPA